MCLQIAKCLLLWCNLILFIAPHLSRLLSDFSLSWLMWCDIIINMAPKAEARSVKALPSCSVHIIILFSSSFSASFAVTRWCVWAAEWEVLFDFFMHVMLRCGFTLFGYNELLLHLCVSSTLVNHGDKVFHYPPTASYSCLFLKINK